MGCTLKRLFFLFFKNLKNYKKHNFLKKIAKSTRMGTVKFSPMIYNELDKKYKNSFSSQKKEAI